MEGKLTSPQKGCISADSWYSCQVDTCIAQGWMHSVSCSVLFWLGHFSNMCRGWNMPFACMLMFLSELPQIWTGS